MFINDLMLKLQNVYDIYNYAGDNAGGVSGSVLEAKGTLASSTKLQLRKAPAQESSSSGSVLEAKGT